MYVLCPNFWLLNLLEIFRLAWNIMVSSENLLKIASEMGIYICSILPAPTGLYGFYSKPKMQHLYMYGKLDFWYLEKRWVLVEYHSTSNKLIGKWFKSYVFDITIFIFILKKISLLGRKQKRGGAGGRRRRRKSTNKSYVTAMKMFVKFHLKYFIWDVRLQKSIYSFKPAGNIRM